MKVGDLIEMRTATARRGIIIECYNIGARKIPMWVVLLSDGRRDRVWSTDMRVISESRRRR